MRLIRNLKKFLNSDPGLKRYQQEMFPLLRKSTQQTYEVRFRYFTKGLLFKVRMQDFRSETVDSWLQWLKKQPTVKNKGRNSFVHELKLLSVVLTWYRNYVDANFVVPITKRHRQMCIYKSVKPRRPDYFAKPEEVRAWVQWLKDHRSNPVYWQLATFMVLTGARVGEACGLLWEVVDLNHGTAHIARVVSWDHKSRRPVLEEAAKTTESVRVLLLPQELVAILQKMKLEAGSRPHVFACPKGQLLKYNAIQSAFNAGFVALGFPWRSTHICRHTFATTALLATRDLSAVQASLGHRQDL